MMMISGYVKAAPAERHDLHIDRLKPVQGAADICLARSATDPLTDRRRCCLRDISSRILFPSRPAASMGTILSSIMVIPFGGALSRL